MNQSRPFAFHFSQIVAREKLSRAVHYVWSEKSTAEPRKRRRWKWKSKWKLKEERFFIRSKAGISNVRCTRDLEPMEESVWITWMRIGSWYGDFVWLKVKGEWRGLNTWFCCPTRDLTVRFVGRVFSMKRRRRVGNIIYYSCLFYFTNFSLTTFWNIRWIKEGLWSELF